MGHLYVIDVEITEEAAVLREQLVSALFVGIAEEKNGLLGIPDTQNHGGIVDGRCFVLRHQEVGIADAQHLYKYTVKFIKASDTLDIVYYDVFGIIKLLVKDTGGA